MPRSLPSLFSLVFPSSLLGVGSEVDMKMKNLKNVKEKVAGEMVLCNMGFESGEKPDCCCDYPIVQR